MTSGRAGVDEREEKVLRVLAWEAPTSEPESWGGERAEARDAVLSLAAELVTLKDALEQTVEALEDAIAAVVNDDSGWTQKDYDVWDDARAAAREALGRQA